MTCKSRFAFLCLICAVILCVTAPRPATAEALLPGATMPLVTGAGLPLIEVATRPITPVGPSLFSGRAEGGLFAPAPPRVPASARGHRLRDGGLAPAHVEKLRQIIGRAESRRDGYDAVQHGAKRPPPKRPTRMTLGEIFDWIRDTPGQPHAIGRYQFIPATLARLVTELDLGPEVIFSPAVQDRLSDLLLAEAGIFEVGQGMISRRQFMNNLAEIWAGLPTSSGRSHYHGYAGNRATISWAEFEREMARIFPG
ncbi:hypothetical protein [Celeribacter indicus]|uniref:Uncharacterized protein n=1 Tax=Celeribacter indicus TaxID=1208324 RepID=A0A0B5DNX0_9RHOB|nr:hypothetical protein [Celeribacter indicus]AJE45283.1 hypothetical protein P73_0568 [Celeribacter indicus]SDX20817.1 hypothetical protein SAMN05443573_11759 [Celeribacter indicus]